MMMSKAKATSSRLLWLAMTLVSLSIMHLFGDVIQPGDKVVPPDTYELRFLGSKLNKATNDKTHTGIFVFTWKGQNPIKILTLPSTEKKTFNPYPTFRVNQGSDWRSVGGWEGPADWVTVQPGQVLTFFMGMGWIESDMATGFKVKEVDKACLILVSKDGDLVSDEIPLPLLPKAK